MYDADLGLGLKEPVYALGSTTMVLCLSLYLWADFRQTKAAIKTRVLLDLQAAIPVFVSLTAGKVHDVRTLNQLVNSAIFGVFEPDAANQLILL